MGGRGLLKQIFAQRPKKTKKAGKKIILFPISKKNKENSFVVACGGEKNMFFFFQFFKREFVWVYFFQESRFLPFGFTPKGGILFTLILNKKKGGKAVHLGVVKKKESSKCVC